MNVCEWVNATSVGKRFELSVDCKSPILHHWCLGARTQSRLMDRVSQMSNLKCEDSNHIITTALLVLFAFIPTQMKKKVFMYICI